MRTARLGTRFDAAPEVGESAILFDRAHARARELGLAYAGAVLPAEAYRLAVLSAAEIVDVRTTPEREFAGRFDPARHVEWRAYGARDPHPDFADRIAACFAPGDPILLLCRSGVRSHHAAELLARAGFRRAFNVLEGFEGDRDANGQRNNLGGWRFAGLPWTQG